MSPVHRIALAALAAVPENAGVVRRIDVRQEGGSVILTLETDRWRRSWVFTDLVIGHCGADLSTVVASKVAGQQWALRLAAEGAPE